MHRFDAFMSNINAAIGRKSFRFFYIGNCLNFLCLDAFQQAKQRALEVRESALQLLTPKVTTDYD